MDIRVLIADDHRILRHGLLSLLSAHEGIKIVGEAENGRDAVRLARDLRPDVVIMDVGMSDLNGIEATKQITSAIPGVHVLALSMHSDQQFISKMFEAGASGYLLKDCAGEELVKAVRIVSGGGTFIGRKVETVVVRDYVSRMKRPVDSQTSQITPREREVLQLIAEGNSTREIAECLHVSVKTIETHRRNIMQKLEIDSVAELTKYAIRKGITSLDE